MSQISAKIRAWLARRAGGRGEVGRSEPPVLYRLPRKRERVHADWSRLRNEASAEYPELPRVSDAALVADREPVFVTARFRSGSTLLWNLFRNTPGVTAYYEPLHPTLQLPSSQRVAAVDPTHDFVDNYWSEYDRIPDLESWYTEPWDRHDLYLDALHWKPALAAYVRVLIRSAEGRPVLQFNRVDFRLAWLRHMFPAARLIHLFRHPRDQWLSALRSGANFGPHDPVQQFAAHDHYFLLPWVADLVSHFPVLDWSVVQHPYRMFYLLWKLSYLWGRNYCEVSFSYERLLESPRQTIGELYERLGFGQQHVARIASLVRSKPTGKWHSYADAAWFAGHERAAEDLLDNFLGPPAECDSGRTDLRTAA